MKSTSTKIIKTFYMHFFNMSILQANIKTNRGKTIFTPSTLRPSNLPQAVCNLFRLHFGFETTNQSTHSTHFLSLVHHTFFTILILSIPGLIKFPFEGKARRIKKANCIGHFPLMKLSSSSNLIWRIGANENCLLKV